MHGNPGYPEPSSASEEDTCKLKVLKCLTQKKIEMQETFKYKVTFRYVAVFATV